MFASLPIYMLLSKRRNRTIPGCANPEHEIACPSIQLPEVIRHWRIRGQRSKPGRSVLIANLALFFLFQGYIVHPARGGLGLPTLASITPASGSPGTTVNVTLTGTNFTPQSGIRLAGFGAAQGNVVLVNSTTITAKFTLNSAVALGAHNVYVVTAAGSSDILPFTVKTATVPVSVSVTPASASDETLPASSL